MSKDKYRKPTLATQDWQFGSSGSYTKLDDDGKISQYGDSTASLLATTIGGGTSLSAILAGSVAIATSALGAGSFMNATATVTGLTTGHKIFLSGCTTACEMITVSPCVSAANTLRVTLINTGSADISGASTFTAGYLAVRDA